MNFNLKKPLKISIITLSVLFFLVFILSYTNPTTWFYKKSSIEGRPFILNKNLKESRFTIGQLDKFRDFLKHEMATTSMIILENGEQIFEYGDPSEISYIASCRKSVLSMLYGKYVDNGSIDLNETIGNMGIDEEDGLLPIEKRATIDHIITSRSGVFHLPANGGYDVNNIKPRGSQEPGNYFVYNNWDFNVAGHILELKSGNSVYDEIEIQLAKPLGFQDWNIDNQSRAVNEKKSRYSAYHIHISTRDMAKIGQLMLQKGKWHNQQLISESWIQKITSAVTPTDTINVRDGLDSTSPIQFSYGYMWWLFEVFHNLDVMQGAYTASGYGGQFITVIPNANIVIAHKTKMDLLSMFGFSRRKFVVNWHYYEILRQLFTL